MGKIKVHEIAKKLALENRDVLLRLRAAGIPVASNLSLVDESAVDLIKKAISVPKEAKPKKAPVARKKKAVAKKAAPKKKVAKKKAAAPAAAKAAKPAGEAAAEAPPAAAAEAAPAPAVTTAPLGKAGPPIAKAGPPIAKAAPVDAAAEPGGEPAVVQAATPAVESAPAPVEAPQPKPAEAQAPSESRQPAAQAPSEPARKPAQPARAAKSPGAPSRAPRTGPPPHQIYRPTFRPGPRQPSRGLGKKSRMSRQEKAAKAAPAAPVIPAELKPLTIAEGATVRMLAEQMSVKASDLLKKLIGRGAMATINTALNPEMAAEVAKEFGYEVKTMGFEDHALMVEQKAVQGGKPVTRPPVVTIMGHVDHGKTTLLDALRASNVVASEHGGITQHIGAYTVQAKNRSVTFLDTPGHEAFTLMRARGAQATDIVVLVVAADDGVKPQTIEAINHARAAGVPMVVAINKIDKPEANADRVKKELADQEILVESWGGETVSVEISAKQKTGLDDLLDMILLVADMRELKADPALPASGIVLEAKLDKSRGPVATVLVQQGTLRVGETFIAGSVTGKARALFNDRGGRMKSAGPSVPVEILGIQGVPAPGDRFMAIEEDKARQIGAYRQQKHREEQMRTSSRLTLDHLFQKIQEGEVKELNLILKTDVQGSIEAIVKTLDRLSGSEVKVRILHAGVGAISESDVLLASGSNAIIVGFNVRPDQNAKALVEKEGVDVRLHTVIYEVADEIKRAMEGLLEPTFEENWLGRAEVRNTFKVPKIGIVAGTYVTDGRMVRNADVRLLRDNVVVYQGKIASLRRFKEDVSEVKSGYECGLTIGNFSDVKVGDIIEAFKVEKAAPRELAI